MPSLVALAVRPGAAFVAELQRAWERGDAVLPVDVRLPPDRQRALVERFGAGVVVDERAGRWTVPGGGRPVEPGDALVVATSGTTGEPKGVVLPAAAVEAAAWATSRRLDVDATVDRWLACLPLAHVGGLGVVTRALVTGTPLVVHPAFDPAAVEDEARRGATLVSLVPTALARVGVGGFRRVLVGGAPPLGPLPANAVCTWGMTETGGGVVYDGVPLEGVEVRVGDDGEVHVRGPMLLRAYRDGADPRVEGGWLPTGDVGSFDDAGRLVVHGRAADVVVTGGEKVWPAAIERVLASHPGVGEVLVGGRPDPEWGQRVVAWVVPAEGADRDKLPAALVAWARERLAPWEVPKEVAVVASLARGESGKLARGRRPSRQR